MVAYPALPYNISTIFVYGLNVRYNGLVGLLLVCGSIIGLCLITTTKRIEGYVIFNMVEYPVKYISYVKITTTEFYCILI